MAKKKITTTSITIASGTDTGEIDCRGKSLMAIKLPASLSSTAITFTAAESSGGTFVAVNDDAGTAISITVASSKMVTLLNKHIALRGLPYIKGVMGSSETAKTILFFFVEE